MQRTMVEGVRIAWTHTAPGDRHQTGRALIRTLAAELAPEADLRVEQRCAVCGGPHGRPQFPQAPLLASTAYADSWVVVAVAHRQDAAAIGIDVELEGSAPELALLFAPGDPPGLRGWTAIEAALKADGRGLMVPPDRVRLSPDGRATVPGGGEFRILPVAAAPGTIVTLALRRPGSDLPPTRRP
ncbi:MAG: 4-phosphopantetheinyl transferase [Actinobacteria bacterium]|nr:4-phosphopantetheinyl transferase [Actinomycetota bacterium]